MPATPFALLARTRFVRLSPWTARTLLLAVLTLSGYGVGLTRGADAFDSAGHGEDIALYSAIVRNMRHGQGYYDAAEQALRAQGFPMASVFNWRLPTLAWLFAALPSDTLARALLALVAAFTVVAWLAALRRALRPGAVVAMALVLLGIVGWPLFGDAYRVHETWAGIAVALSIAAAALDRRRLSVAAGLGALAIRELALPYALLALFFSLRDRRRREAIAWAAGIALFCVGVCLHAWLVSHHQIASDRARAESWVQLGGWWFVLKTGLTNLWLIAAPPLVTALLWPSCLLGLLAWQDRLGQRIAATVATYVGLFLLVGLPCNYLWGLLYAGLAPLGLLRAPAAIRDLVRRSVAV
jgi:hypothetical protein